MATLEREQTASSLLVVSLVIESCSICLYFKLNTGGYIECKKNLNGEESFNFVKRMDTRF